MLLPISSLYQAVIDTLKSSKIDYFHHQRKENRAFLVAIRGLNPEMDTNETEAGLSVGASNIVTKKKLAQCILRTPLPGHKQLLCQQFHLLHLCKDCVRDKRIETTFVNSCLHLDSDDPKGKVKVIERECALKLGTAMACRLSQ